MKKVTALTVLKPLYIQLTQLVWPKAITKTPALFRYHGWSRMLRETLDALRRHLPQSRPFLMYADWRILPTFLPPAEVGQPLDLIGKAIPTRNPGAARGWFALRTQRAGRTGTSRWLAWATGTIRKTAER